eukprot:6204418-Pleurochrysis_carterae.AAC.1
MRHVMRVRPCVHANEHGIEVRACMLTMCSVSVRAVSHVYLRSFRHCCSAAWSHVYVSMLTQAHRQGYAWACRAYAHAVDEKGRETLARVLNKETLIKLDILCARTSSLPQSVLAGINVSYYAAYIPLPSRPSDEQLTGVEVNTCWRAQQKQANSVR